LRTKGLQDLHQTKMTKMIRGTFYILLFAKLHDVNITQLIYYKGSPLVTCAWQSLLHNCCPLL